MSLEGKGTKKEYRNDDFGKMTKPTFTLKKEAGGITKWMMEMDKYLHRHLENSHMVLYDNDPRPLERLCVKHET